MIKAVFLDFYGTVVHEDGDEIRIINHKIMNSGTCRDIDAIGSYWWNSFQSLCNNSYGVNFETQRVIERKSLADTVKHFNSTENIDEICEKLFARWVKPPAFEEAAEFFRMCPLPIYIVSNIDRADIMEAIAFHGFTPAGVFTSEDARAYKPRKELFELALHETGLIPEKVVHIGDSLTSDIKGASALGIHTIWINRNKKIIPEGIITVQNLMEVFKTQLFIS